MTTLNSEPGIIDDAITKETMDIDETSPSETKESSQEASLRNSVCNNKWHIDAISASDLDEGDCYTVWKDIKLVLKNNKEDFSYQHLLCDKSQPSIYNSINDVMQSIESRLSPPDKEIMLHYLLDMCIENVLDRYQEYTCSLIEEFDFDFDMKVRDI
jgi:hypothetical protein